MIELDKLEYETVADIKVMSVEYIMSVMDPYLIIDPMDRNLDQISLRSGRAFGQCQRLYIHEARALEKFLGKKAELELGLRRYYSGQANPEMYKRRPLSVSILKTDLEMWVKADKAYIQISEYIDEQKRKVKMLEQYFDRIKSIGYEIKSAIEWRKYLDGN